MRITFYGGVGTVTGSNFLVANTNSKLLVDCGLEQGTDFSVNDVYGPFPYDPASVDALVITHAHLDHVGLVPKLVKEGFRGKIFMTPPTRDLAVLILLDSANILAEEARRLGREPLYTDRDVETAFAQVETLNYHVQKEVAPGLSIYLRNTGHVLGSASVQIRDENDTSLVLTGDIGNSPSPLLPNWEPVQDADALVMESVYGDRIHPQRGHRTERLREVLRAAINRGGAILIPAFSLERTQLMLYELSNFFSAGELSQVPVFLDSPLAIKVTAVYDKWGPTYFKPEAEDEMEREGSLFDFPFLRKTLAREESEAIAKTPNPKIIIAGAGMSHGGRIGRWESRYLPNQSTTLVIAGYQAPGSPGRRMADGSSSVRLNGREVEIRAKVELLEGWSAHADRDELFNFAEIALADKRLKAVFNVLGEPSAERFLAQRLHDYLGAHAVVPVRGETWEITKESVKKI